LLYSLKKVYFHIIKKNGVYEKECGVVTPHSFLKYSDFKSICRFNCIMKIPAVPKQILSTINQLKCKNSLLTGTNKTSINTKLETQWTKSQGMPAIHQGNAVFMAAVNPPEKSPIAKYVSEQSAPKHSPNNPEKIAQNTGDSSFLKSQANNTSSGHIYIYIIHQVFMP